MSPSGKLLNLRVAPGDPKTAPGVTSKGGLGELPNLAIFLFGFIESNAKRWSTARAQESDKCTF